ncbi:unnamed protein product [Schistocephalus solidus]|uniref:Uncharacterized protein n=1 Tax=Schistocephalus solidus TaxID=70667 RepID=A0A183TID0_SCHSO|nr:unnamed protein product [Schistocephalus solidus]
MSCHFLSEPDEPLPTLTTPPSGGVQCMPDVVPTSHHDAPDESPGPRGPRIGGPRPASTSLSELALLRASETEGRGHFRRVAARRRHSFNQENLSIFAQRMADIADALERDHNRYRRRRSWSIQLTGADAPSNDSFTFGRLTRTASSSLLWLSSSMADLVSQPINYLYRWFNPASREQGPRLRTNSVMISRSSRGSWVERSRTFSMEMRGGPRPPFPSSFDTHDVLQHSGGRPGRSPQLPYDHPAFTFSPDVLSERNDADDRTPTQDADSEGIG